MAAYANALVLDGGLNYLDANAVRYVLLKAYTAADTYATVATNIICSVTITAADMSIAGADGAPRILTVASKSGTASANSGAAPDLHLALTNGLDTVLIVTDETSNQVVTNGNEVTLPSFTYTAPQPTN